MEKELIEFIQNPKNIELLNLGQIDTLLQKCPVSLRPQLIKMLADSDIDLKDTDGDSMYGIQTAISIKHGFRGTVFRNTYKITVGAPDRKNKPLAYGINSTRSDGVKGGSLVAFKSLKDAYNFIKLLGKDGDLSPFKLSSASSYNWVEVPYKEDPNVKFWITDSIRDYYDLDKRKQKQQLEKAYNLFYTDFAEEFSDKYFSNNDLKEYLEHKHFDFKYWVYDPTIHDNGMRISCFSNPKADNIEILKKAALEYLTQKHINNKQFSIIDNADDNQLKQFTIQLNDNKKLLNDIANQLNNEFGVNLQQNYPEIFS